MGDSVSGVRAPQLKIRQTESGIAIAVRLTPKAARDAVDGLDEFGGDPVLKAAKPTSRSKRLLPTGSTSRAQRSL
jgi:hypothetical protein